MAFRFELYSGTSPSNANVLAVLYAWAILSALLVYGMVLPSKFFQT